jgi:hypothetical protein
MSNQVQVGNIVAASLGSAIGMAGQPTVSINVLGNITTGSLTPQVSDDDVNWFDVVILAADGSDISSVLVPGLYRGDVNGFQNFRLQPTSDFVGAYCTVQYFAYPTPLLTKIVNATDLSLLAPTWVAGTYPANSVVLYSGSFWSNTTSTSGVPGVSGWNNYATIGDLITFILSS